MESLKIVGLSVGAAITSGILHDQVTARTDSPRPGLGRDRHLVGGRAGGDPARPLLPGRWWTTPPATVLLGVHPVDQRAFIAVSWTHLTSYLSGFVGGLVVCGWAVWKRGRIRRGA